MLPPALLSSLPPPPPPHPGVAALALCSPCPLLLSVPALLQGASLVISRDQLGLLQHAGNTAVVHALQGAECFPTKVQAQKDLKKQIKKVYIYIFFFPNTPFFGFLFSTKNRVSVLFFPAGRALSDRLYTLHYSE